MRYLKATEIIILAICLYFLTFWVYIYFFSKRSPIKLFFSALKGFLISPIRKYLFLLVFLMAFNIIETKYDDEISEVVGINLTAVVKDFEGGLVGKIQGWGWLFDYYFTYAYIFGFAVLCIAPIIIFSGTGNASALKKVTIGLWLNYLIALPFYLFLMVYEISSVENSRYAVLVMDKLNPLIMKYYRPTSGINNCFPSFHTACSIFSSYITVRYAYLPAKVLGVIFAISVVISTFYLGIHWFIDVVAGLFVGILTILIVQKYTK